MAKATKNNATKQKRKKWTDAEKEKAIAVFETTGNLSAAARAVGAPISTVKGWVQAKPSEEIARARLDAKKRFIEEAWQSVLKAIQVGNRKLEDLMVGDLKKIRLPDISTYIGTLYDKIALASGEATQNIKQEVQGQVTNRHEYDITLRDILERRAGDSASDLPLAAFLRRRDSITQ